MWLVELRDWYPGVGASEPEYERLIQIGLNIYEYYVGKLRGLSAFSGELDSLLRSVGGVGEAGASYVNKWFNCNQELFLLFPSPDIRYKCICRLWLGHQFGYTMMWRVPHVRRKLSLFPEHLISLPLGSSRFYPLMIYTLHNLSVLGLCLRIHDSGLFAWISQTVLSRTYFIIAAIKDGPSLHIEEPQPTPCQKAHCYYL